MKSNTPHAPCCSATGGGSVCAEKPAAAGLSRLDRYRREHTSAGNNYSDPQFQDEPMERFFAALKERASSASASA